MNKKKCYKDIYAAYKWVLFAAILAQLLFGGYMTIGIYAEWMYVLLPILLIASAAAARFCWDRKAVRVIVRVVAALPTAFGVLMIALQAAASAASGWALSMDTILWDCVRSTMPMLMWLAPVCGIAARTRGTYDRIALCVTEGWLTALAVITVVFAHRPNSAILTDNGWGIPHIAALYALAGICAAAAIVAIVYAAARPIGASPAADDGTDTFGGLVEELQKH